jgi:nitroreductase
VTKFSENLNVKTDKKLKRLTILYAFKGIKERRSIRSLGLESCWFEAFNEKQVTDALKVSNIMRSVAMLPIVYSSESQVRPQRQSVNEFVHYETF